MNYKMAYRPELTNGPWIVQRWVKGTDGIPEGWYDEVQNCCERSAWNWLQATLAWERLGDADRAAA